MHVHIGYVLSKEDVDGIHIVPARDRRDEQGGTYPSYKIGHAFILHYPAAAWVTWWWGVWPLRYAWGYTALLRHQDDPIDPNQSIHCSPLHRSPCNKHSLIRM